MQKLQEDWLTNGLIDFEYKKYVLLAYLNWVSQNFNEAKLYPHMAELINHYQSLLNFHQRLKSAEENGPKTLSKIDLEKLKLEYEKDWTEDGLMDVIEQIVLYAIPQLKSHLEQGKDLYEFVEEQILIEPIGITPLDVMSGYLFISAKRKETQVYSYNVALFEQNNERFRAVRTRYHSSFQPSISQSYESYKLKLHREEKDQSVSATWLVNSRMDFPVSETLLPIAKRSLARKIAGSAQA
jgi:hypothetical protein